jgi:hypothetical protein
MLENGRRPRAVIMVPGILEFSIGGPAKAVAKDSTGVFAVLKRGLIGEYHHASKKHLGRYVDEFTFRLNEGNVKHHTLARLESLVGAVTGKR